MSEINKLKKSIHIVAYSSTSCVCVCGVYKCRHPWGSGALDPNRAWSRILGGSLDAGLRPELRSSVKQVQQCS